jgi:hypothetical protein
MLQLGRGITAAEDFMFVPENEQRVPSREWLELKVA